MQQLAKNVDYQSLALAREVQGLAQARHDALDVVHVLALDLSHRVVIPAYNIIVPQHLVAQPLQLVLIARNG